MKSAKSIT